MSSEIENPSASNSAIDLLLCEFGAQQHRHQSIVSGYWELLFQPPYTMIMWDCLGYHAPNLYIYRWIHMKHKLPWQPSPEQCVTHIEKPGG